MMTKHILCYFFLFSPLAFDLTADDKATSESPWKQFSLHLGPNLMTANSIVRLGNQKANLSLNLEEMLGMEKLTPTLKLDLYWRFTENRRHSFDLSYFFVHRQGVQNLNLDNSFFFDDKQIAADAAVQSKLKVDILELGYAYSLVQDERLDLALGASMLVMPLEFKLLATKLGESEVDIEKSFVIPLPLLTFRSEVAVSERFFIFIKEKFLYLELSKFQVLATHSTIGTEFLLSNYLGLGASFEFFALHLKSAGEDYPGINLIGRYDLEYAGAHLYSKLFF